MAGVTAVDAVTITDGAVAADITMDGAITGITTNRTAAGEKPPRRRTIGAGRGCVKQPAPR
jgi:hypothetical protein